MKVINREELNQLVNKKEKHKFDQSSMNRKRSLMASVKSQCREDLRQPKRQKACSGESKSEMVLEGGAIMSDYLSSVCRPGEEVRDPSLSPSE